MLDHLDVGEQVHHLAQAALVQLGTGEVFGQDVFEPLVSFFDGTHGIVNDGADFRRVGRGGNGRPPGGFRHEEDVLSDVFVLILLETIAFRYQLVVLGLEAELLTK